VAQYIIIQIRQHIIVLCICTRTLKLKNIVTAKKLRIYSEYLTVYTIFICV